MFDGLIFAVNLIDEAVYDFNPSSVGFFVCIMDKDAVNKFVNIFVGQLFEFDVLPDDINEFWLFSRP